MAERYHYLIGGLPELFTTEQTAEQNLDSIQEDVLELLHPSDRRQFLYLLYRNDNKNLLRLIRDRQGIHDDSTISFHRPATFTHQELEEGLIGIFPLADYMSQFLEEVDIDRPLTLAAENRLIELYFDEAIERCDPFLSDYFAYKRDIKNILSAINARRDGKEVGEVLIGQNDLSHTLATSNQPDFGIAQSYPFVSRVRDMLDQRQLTELERQVDSLLLDHIAETSEGHIFDEITVFAYFIELSLAARWLHRSASEGREKLREILRKVLSNSALPQQVRADELAL